MLECLSLRVWSVPVSAALGQPLQHLPPDLRTRLLTHPSGTVYPATCLPPHVPPTPRAPHPCDFPSGLGWLRPLARGRTLPVPAQSARGQE